MTAIPADVPRLRRREVEAPTARRVERGVRDVRRGDLPPGEVEVRVDWSSVNYKDGLATRADGKVARISPLIPGIDLAGEVVASDDPAIAVGTPVLAHGYDLGVSRHGGYTRVPARARPAGSCRSRPGLTPRDAMAIGTAGFTAAMSVVALEDRGLQPDRRAGPRDRRERRRRRHGAGDPGRARLRGLGGDRQARRGRLG